MKRARILNPRLLLALAAVCGAAYVLLFVVAASTRAQKASCGPEGAHTVVADRAARIYRVSTGHTPLGTFYNYFGCTPGQGKSRLLASTQPNVRIREIRLRGAVAGFIVDFMGVDTGDSTLKAFDLADGHVIHTVVTTYGLLSATSLVTYVLAPSGNIAWALVKSNDLRPRSVVTVSRAIGHSVTILDQGTSIRASSLRLRGHVLDWVDGGQHRHARLP